MSIVEYIHYVNMFMVCTTPPPPPPDPLQNRRERKTNGVSKKPNNHSETEHLMYTHVC